MTVRPGGAPLDSYGRTNNCCRWKRVAIKSRFQCYCCCWNAVVAFCCGEWLTVKRTSSISFVSEKNFRKRKGCQIIENKYRCRLSSVLSLNYFHFFLRLQAAQGCLVHRAIDAEMSFPPIRQQRWSQPNLALSERDRYRSSWTLTQNCCVLSYIFISGICRPHISRSRSLSILRKELGWTKKKVLSRLNGHVFQSKSSLLQRSIARRRTPSRSPNYGTERNAVLGKPGGFTVGGAVWITLDSVRMDNTRRSDKPPGRHSFAIA